MVMHPDPPCARNRRAQAWIAVEDVPVFAQ